MKRLPAIDVARGLAVVLMVMHHVVDAWTWQADREGGLWKALRHLGGMPAPGFLVLAGLSAALLAVRARDKGVAIAVRALEAVRRGLYVLGIAFAFRVFAFLTGLNHLSAWRGLFRVDVLNCMGVALALTGGLGALARTRTASIAAGLSIFVGFVVPAPWLYGHEPGFGPDLLANYVSGVGDLVLFPAFPWFGFVGAGWALGEAIAAASSSSKLPAALVAGGSALFVVPWLVDAYVPVTVFPTHNWWRASATYVVMRVGIQCVLLGLAFSWRSLEHTRVGSALVLLGQHSLVIYVAHLELAYGILVKPLFHAVPVWASLLGTTALVVISVWVASRLEARERPAPRPAVA